MPLNESDTRSLLINPALYRCGWTEDLISHEETAGAIEIIDGKPQRGGGRVDTVLRVKLNSDDQPVAVALIEAKAESKPPLHGLEQAKRYAEESRRFNVAVVFSTNGHQFVEYDRRTGVTSPARPMDFFPSPQDLRLRYEQFVGFNLGDEAARPLRVRYPLGETARRYYQDAAIRAVIEKIARCTIRGEPRRVLLSLATGSGKTRIAVQLLKRISDAGQMRRALFICDRDELRTQALGAFKALFGANAAAVQAGKPEKNARVLIATYQTLGVDGEDGEADFLRANYPENYFSHIVIDECHRSAWGKWSEVLKRNPGAVQIGLTATPRQLIRVGEGRGDIADDAITADNVRHFGEPVYEYDISQGIEDGYLAACEIIQRDIYLGTKGISERFAGLDQPDLLGKRLKDGITGQELGIQEARQHYEPSSFEDVLQLPERVDAMCDDLFAHLLATGGPEQKTIVFCARDSHADRVAAAMENLYVDWCEQNGKPRVQHYAFKCTAAGGGDYLSELKGSKRTHFIATTVDLLTTGVDVPDVRNIVFFRYIRSPISFYQMIGRGTRLAPDKLMFRVYDYTDATRLFGEEFLSYIAPRLEGASDVISEELQDKEYRRDRTIQVEGFTVLISDAGHYILTMVDGKALPVSLEEYKEQVSTRLVREAPTLDAFRRLWIIPNERQHLLSELPDRGQSAHLVRALENMDAFDLYDVLAELGYGMAPRTREERAESFKYKQAEWLERMPTQTADTVIAITSQFARAGTEGLESPNIFDTLEVRRAGGLRALKLAGRPSDVLIETKERMFAA